MQLFLIAALTMTAFAANSVLNRLGVTQYGMDPVVFALVRVAAGVVVLWAMVALQRGAWPAGSWGRRIGGALALALYMAGFSLAYLSLDAGAGALILFGMTQVTMFAGAALSGDRITAMRAAGAGIALVGLGVLVWPAGDVTLSAGGVGLMVLAGLGWGIYSLLGRGEARPLAATAANFALCLPLLAPLLIWSDGAWTYGGIVLAVVAGGLTSGLGYALWYRIVPLLGATRAAVTQLSVPVIAAFGGLLFLAEPLGWRFGVAAVLVLGGIGVSLIKRRAPGH